MSVNVLYRTSATATGGRDGRSVVEGGALDVKLSTPKELGGAGAAGNNPEQLFAAGYSACFLGAMKVVASHGGAKVPDDTTVKATRSEEHTSELQSLMRISYAVFCLKKKKTYKIKKIEKRTTIIRHKT